MITICTGPMPVSTAFDLVPLREFLPSRPTGSCWPRRGVLPGDAEAREFIAFRLRSGQVLAAMNVNIWDVSDIIQALVRTRKTSPQTDREGSRRLRREQDAQEANAVDRKAAGNHGVMAGTSAGRRDNWPDINE